MPDTPAVMIDLRVVEANIARVQDQLNRYGLACRPHIKTHKLVRFAKLQIDAGAVGIACQKIGEAEVMAYGGIGDIFIPYNILGRMKLDRLADLSQRCQVSVTADNEAVVNGLSGRFSAAANPLEVLVECDTGHGRCGVQTATAAKELGRIIAASPGLRFGGLMTYPPMQDMDTVNAWLVEARDLLVRAGIECPRISTGGTPNLKDVGRLTVATEHRPGTYIYNDRSLVSAGHCGIDDCALTVRATIVSRPSRDRAIIDAGSKVLTSDLLGLNGYGLIRELPNAEIYALSEEHGHVDLSASRLKPEVGTCISIIPNHACVVSNMVDEVYVSGAEHVETMSVDARGRVR